MNGKRNVETRRAAGSSIMAAMSDVVPKRRWFRFSLRTLFVIVTLVALWLGYELNWIRERRKFLNAPGVFESTSIDTLGPNFVIPPPLVPPPRAPGMLRLFGERGVVAIEIPIERQLFDESLSSDCYKEVQRARRLFPEALAVDAYPVPP